MSVGNDPNIEGFVDVIRLAWAVHLMLILDVIAAREAVSNASSNDLGYLHSCLEVIFSNNVFQSLLDKVLQTAAFQVYLLCNILLANLLKIKHFLTTVLQRALNSQLIGLGNVYALIELPQLIVSTLKRICNFCTGFTCYLEIASTQFLLSVHFCLDAFLSYACLVHDTDLLS